jgi:hypothetical protein
MSKPKSPIQRHGKPPQYASLALQQRRQLSQVVDKANKRIKPYGPMHIGVTSNGDVYEIQAHNMLTMPAKYQRIESKAFEDCWDIVHGIPN